MSRPTVTTSTVETASNTKLEIAMPSNPDGLYALVYVTVVGDVEAELINPSGWGFSGVNTYEPDGDVTTILYRRELVATDVLVTAEWVTPSAASAVAVFLSGAVSPFPISFFPAPESRATFDDIGETAGFIPVATSDDIVLFFGATRDAGGPTRTLDPTTMSAPYEADTVATAGAGTGVHTWVGYNQTGGQSAGQTPITYQMAGEGVPIAPLTPTSVGADSGSLVSSGATSVAVPFPVGSAVGDVALIAATTQAANSTETTAVSAVSSALSQWSLTHSEVSSGDSAGSVLYWKTLDADDLASGQADIDLSDPGDMSWAVMVWRDIDQTAPFDSTPVVSAAQYGTSTGLTALSTTVDNAVEAAAVFAVSQGAPSHADSPVTALTTDVGVSQTVTVGETAVAFDTAVRGTAGAGTVRTVTAVNAAANEVHHTVVHFALRPTFSTGSRQTSLAVVAKGVDDGPSVTMVPLAIEPLEEPVTLQGTASDAEGVNSLGLIIHRLLDDQYWNGAAYQPAQVTVPAVLTGIVSDPVRNWSYDATGAFTVISEYDVTTIADDAGAGQLWEGSADLQILVQRDSDSQYWNGTAFQVAEPDPWPSAADTGSFGVRFTYDITLPVGTYTVTSRAVDADTNIEPVATRSTIPLEVVTAASGFEVVSPANGSDHSYFLVNADPIEVIGFEDTAAAVEVRIMSGGDVWNGAAWVADTDPLLHWHPMVRNGNIVTYNAVTALSLEAVDTPVDVKMRRVV